jgi:hypothetical protein
MSSSSRLEYRAEPSGEVLVLAEPEAKGLIYCGISTSVMMSFEAPYMQACVKSLEIVPGNDDVSALPSYVCLLERHVGHVFGRPPAPPICRRFWRSALAWGSRQRQSRLLVLGATSSSSVTPSCLRGLGSGPPTNLS